MDKKEAVNLLLEKRFGEKLPENIPNLQEVNTFIPAGDDDSSFGIGIQLIILDSEGNKIKEEYQITSENIIFSWGNSPVIDSRSLENRISK